MGLISGTGARPYENRAKRLRLPHVELAPATSSRLATNTDA